MPDAPPPPHQRHLDGLRALLALYVVAHHSWLTVWSPESGQTPSKAAAFWTGWLSHGLTAVDGFIVLSGFVLMRPVTAGGGQLRGGVGSFYWRRAKRILPPFYAAVAFSLAMIAAVVGRKTGTHWDLSIPPTWKAVVGDLFMAQDVVEPGRINHAFWTVAIETRIYLLFPLVVWLFRRLGTWPAGVMLAAGGIWLAFACKRWGVESLQLNPIYFALFVMGGVAARGPWPAWASAPAAIVATAVAVWQQGGWAKVTGFAMRQPMQDLTIGLAFAGWLAYGSAPSARWWRATLGWRPLAAVGVFAYSLYLVHAPVVQLAWQWSARPLHLTGGPALAVLLAVDLPLTLVVAYGFFLIAERPFLSRRQRAAAADELPISGHQITDTVVTATGVATPPTVAETSNA